MPPRRAFAALGIADYRTYVMGASAAMMADNVEHVISYYQLYRTFHSPALGGFAVISHWVPYLLLAGYTGGLADRFDIRRLIQAGMLMFMAVSLCWGLMFLTHTLTLWKAVVMLIVHGLAGAIWLPSAQVLIHRIVPPEALASAVRLNATGRYLGFLAGPALGAGLMMALGPVAGIWVNALIYLPLFLWLIRAPYGSAAAGRHPVKTGLGGFAEVIATMKVVSRHPVLLSMTLLIGAGSFFVGSAYQAQMPQFAADLGHGRADFSYSMLLAADAAGGLLGGIILESRGLLPPHARTAYILAMIWCLALIGFARIPVYAVAVPLLFVAGFVELSFNSMAQALVQLHAPADMRGRVIGVYSMAALGLRAFSGISVGLLGARVGIHDSLALSAACFLATCLALIGARRLRRA